MVAMRLAAAGRSTRAGLSLESAAGNAALVETRQERASFLKVGQGCEMHAWELRATRGASHSLPSSDREEMGLAALRSEPTEEPLRKRVKA